MSDEEQKAIREGEFRDELKGIMQEAMSEAPTKAKSTLPLLLGSAGGIAVLLTFAVNFAHLPKDVEEVHAHIGIHDSQILSLMSGQSEMKERAAQTAQVSNDTNERVKRIEATLDAKFNR
jgi:hypothetical protein